MGCSSSKVPKVEEPSKNKKAPEIVLTPPSANGKQLSTIKEASRESVSSNISIEAGPLGGYVLPAAGGASSSGSGLARDPPLITIREDDVEGRAAESSDKADGAKAQPQGGQASADAAVAGSKPPMNEPTSDSGQAKSAGGVEPATPVRPAGFDLKQDCSPGGDPRLGETGSTQVPLSPTSCDVLASPGAASVDVDGGDEVLAKGSLFTTGDAVRGLDSLFSEDGDDEAAVTDKQATAPPEPHSLPLVAPSDKQPLRVEDVDIDTKRQGPPMPHMSDGSSDMSAPLLGSPTPGDTPSRQVETPKDAVVGKAPAPKAAPKPAERSQPDQQKPVAGDKRPAPGGASSHRGGRPPGAPDARKGEQQNKPAPAGGKKGKQNDTTVQAKDYDLVEKKYEIGAKLGEGTFGVVHDCWRRNDPKKVVHAVKYIDKMAQDKDMILLETNMMRQLDHPTIVRCLDVFDEPFFMCIVMEKWTGRDVVSRLIEYTEAGKDLAEPFVANLVRQMLASLVYIHSKGIIHRDVKMDNYLLDRPVIDDVTVKVALADFGCAAYLEPGKRMTEGVGTKVYKAPEFIMEDYDHKVDVWAVGVSQYALLAGTLPFETERAILHTRPAFPEDLSPNCTDLLKTLLRKNDARRPTAEEAMEHPFVRPSGQARQEEFKRTASAVGKSTRQLAARNEPIEASIVERREVLMARVQGQAAGSAAPVFGSDFQVRLRVGKAEEILKFAWWSKSDVERLVVENYLAARPPPQGSFRGRGMRSHGQDAGSVHQLQDICWTPEALEGLLSAHKIDVNTYGVGKAKSVDEVADEFRKGEAVLMQDVMKSKNLVRLVDHVVLQIELDYEASPNLDRSILAAKGINQLVLVCRGQEEDASDALGLRLPAAQRRPHETTRQVAARLLEDLKMPGCEVTLRYDAADRVEATEDSELYPSLTSVKRRHIVPGKMRISNVEALNAVGLSSGSLSKVDASKKDLAIEFMSGMMELAWWTPTQCKARRVSLINAHTSQNLTTFSALVRVPMNFTEVMINRLLWTYGIDVSKFNADGKGKLLEMAEELSKGEAALCERRGKVVRVVSMVVLRVDDRATGRSLVEVEVVDADGKTRARDRLPSVKLRPQEDLQDAIGRLIKMRLQLDLSAVRVLEGKTEVVEEERENDRYQGLVTLYRRHIMRAEVTTSSASAQSEATHCPPTADELMDDNDSDPSLEAASSTRRKKRRSSLRSGGGAQDKKAKPRKGRQ